MREISTKDIIKAVKDMCIDANYNLGKDVEDALQKAYEKEESPVGPHVSGYRHCGPFRGDGRPGLN
ncbi:hypothetical protein AMJ44_13000 [candidate division WOR-1 bacterium DG_54_3]|uniref:Uncharacterized protein n=1 Tax=candidate division WOR-1 bacterium DG_54_3 TaxID=1703775 RepID=A0A0S7XQM9_UNCSA|nr:MAG: hypothetical protein AMJ44_13000 [candidate division WOR-1 bacterium DG_54_3]